MSSPSPAMRHLSAVTGTILVLLATAVAGCGGGGSGDKVTTSAATAKKQPKVVEKATLAKGKPIPRPAGKVVLTILGAKNANNGKNLELSREQLEQMGTIRYEVDDEDATGKRVEFSGPLLSDLLEYAGVSGPKLHTLALNDYAIDIPTAHLRKYPVMLATRMDGRTMTVKDYGPTRIVYPNVDYEIGNSFDPLWTWQLKEISVP